MSDDEKWKPVESSPRESSVKNFNQYRAYVQWSIGEVACLLINVDPDSLSTGTHPLDSDLAEKYDHLVNFLNRLDKSGLKSEKPGDVGGKQKFSTGKRLRGGVTHLSVGLMKLRLKDAFGMLPVGEKTAASPLAERKSSAFPSASLYHCGSAAV